MAKKTGPQPRLAGAAQQSHRKSGLQIQREKAEMTRAELAEAVGTSRTTIIRLESPWLKKSIRMTAEWAERFAPILKCAPHEILYPHLADVDPERFRSIYAEGEDEPTVSVRDDFLRQMMPGLPKRNLELRIIDTDDLHRYVARGDALVLDLDDKSPARPGVYAVEIGGAVQWRFLSPTAAGLVQLSTDNPDIPKETVKPEDLKIIGRAKMRISAL
ncbi:hypothetical protein [Chelativorans sp. AA-79]|uniref:hypothetical protein n=1 Tax=Chelativorans sp. AA-79 TaxID=3028735 RepID=UPI0023FA05BD|nr:hypothetical protein [Chelativorans sp. AA-79]WEX10324.1 hypothetical protein PVE73_05020 [Chelativorans sp. AA-79]